MKRVIFISSTGGHLRELMKLQSLFKEYDYFIVTEKDISTRYLEEEYKDRVSYLPYSTRSKAFKYIFIYFYVIIKSIILFSKLKPDVIISTGTHTAVPMFYLAKIFGKKVIYIETYANRNKKTLTGKIVYPITDLFIVQCEEMKNLYPNAIYI